MAIARTRLDASMLEDYKLVYEVFSKLIFLVDANEILKDSWVGR